MSAITRIMGDVKRRHEQAYKDRLLADLRGLIYHRVEVREEAFFNGDPNFESGVVHGVAEAMRLIKGFEAPAEDVV